MSDPSDRGKDAEQKKKNKNLKLLTSKSKSAKYLVISRIESDETFSRVFPFLVKVRVKSKRIKG